MADGAGPVKRRRYTLEAMDSEIKITGEPSAAGDSCAFKVDRPVLPDRSAHFAGSDTAVHSGLAT